MLLDILNYIPDPKNGRPIADGKVYFLIAGYIAPTNDADIDASKFAMVTYQTDDSDIEVPQPIYTSQGGTLIIGNQRNQPKIEVSNDVDRVAVYDKCGRLVYSVSYQQPNLVFGIESLRAGPVDLDELPGGVFTFAEIQYLPGNNEIWVFANGSKLELGADYTESSSTSITLTPSFIAQADAGTRIEVWSAEILPNLSIKAEDVSYNDAISQAGVSNVQQAIQLLLSNEEVSSSVFTSFQGMIESDLDDVFIARTSGYRASLPGVGAGSYVKTSATGTPGDTDGGSYFIATNGQRWELLHNGTVYLEQFGAQQDTALGLIPRAASAASRVSKVTTSLTKLVFDRTWPVQRSNIEIDFNGADIDWTGVYNIYFDDYGLGVAGENFGIGDRTVGVIGWRSAAADADIKTVTSSITDGTNMLELNNVSGLSVGDYVRLDITYPRRNTSQLARIQSVTGSIISINYAFAWDVDSCTLQKLDVYEKVSVKGIGQFRDLAIFEDTTESLAWAACPVAFRGCAGVILDGGQCSNTNLPAVNVFECQDIEIKNYEAHNPRNIDPGRGYCAQINRSSFFNVEKCVGWNTRHAFDISGGSFGTVFRTYGVRDNPDGSFTFTSHGEYEHDVVFRECYDIGARITIALARSGISFGAANKRMSIESCSFSGLAFLENVDDLTVINTDFNEADATGHRFGVRGNVVVDNCTFKDTAIIVVARHNDNTGAVPANNGVITFRDCRLTSSVKHFFHQGDYVFDNCVGLERLYYEFTNVDNPVAIWPSSYLFNNMYVGLRNSTQLRANDKILFNDATVAPDGTAQAIFCYNGQVIFNNTDASSATSREIRVRAPITKVIGGEWNNVGVVPELATAVRYELDGVRASNTANSWRAVNTTNLAGIANNCTFTGAGGLQLGGAGSTGTTWRLSNVTSAYDMLTDVGAIVTSVRYRGVTSPTLNDWVTWP